MTIFLYKMFFLIEKQYVRHVWLRYHKQIIDKKKKWWNWFFLVLSLTKKEIIDNKGRNYIFKIEGQNKLLNKKIIIITWMLRMNY